MSATYNQKPCRERQAVHYVTVIVCHLCHTDNNDIYCIDGNIREVFIFVNFAKRTNLRIRESRENYYHNIGTEEKE